MRDLVSVPIALTLVLIAIVVAYFALQMVVSEIQPGFSESFVDFTNHPTKTTNENLGVAKIIAASWAGLMLFAFIFLAPATNAVSDTMHWSFGLVGKGWRHTHNFRYRLGSVHRSGILHTLVLLGSVFGVLLIT